MEPSTPVDINTIKRRFVALNRDRVARINKALLWRQRDFLKLLPLLLHINDESLPGYVSKSAPAGISNYKPNKATLDAVKRINKKFTLTKRALSRYNIYSIFLTGSSGTVAQTEHSDFDIWVCHSPDMSSEDIALLEAKTHALSQWCSSLELEVHFFLMDEERFRSQKHANLDSENSGSAQHHLLLEEFYRTGIYIAGRYPLWWLVPPEHEHDYDKHVAMLREEKRIREYEIIDFGGLDNIPAEEFYGASLWQIYKGIDSPYKSVLKILLMEAYASEFPNIELLCMRLKKLVYENVSDLIEIDPYVMMCHKVEEYLQSRLEEDRLELARRCFYFKTETRLSNTQHHDPDDLKIELLSTLVKQWGWDDAHLLMLDSRPTWKIHRVLEERKNLVNELSRSYKLLSSFARKNTDASNIDQHDMSILGRKLYAAFERTAGKIDIINPGISANLVEECLSFHELEGAWLLFRGNVNIYDRNRQSPLKRGRSITELLCWCHFNHLINANTVLTLHTSNSKLKTRELKQILSSLDSQFPRGYLPESSSEQFSKPSYAMRTILFINVGMDSMQTAANNEERQIVSNRNNPLSYSGLLENLVLSIDQVHINSWQEVYAHNYTGITEVIECLCKNVQMAKANGKVLLPVISAFSFSSSLDYTLARRVEALFTDLIRFFLREDMPSSARYILGVEDNYYLLYKIRSEQQLDQISYKRVGTYKSLLQNLALTQEAYSPVVFDELTLNDHYLPQIYSRHRQGNIDVYVHSQGNVATIYVLDEKAALYSQQQQYYSLPLTIAQFDSFLHAVTQRLSAHCINGDSVLPLNINFHTLQQLNNRWVIKDYAVDPLISQGRAIDVTVIIELTNENFHYRVFCDELEFSSLQHGDTLFEKLADHIISLRLSRSDYPLYITDIDLPLQPGVSDPDFVSQTITYLRYKRNFEQQLNLALEARLNTPGNTYSIR